MNKQKVVVVDYGLGNLYSVQRALEVAGASEISITDDREAIRQADRLVLPGVGAFADGMRGLHERDLVGEIHDYAASGRPLLGICLGMQMLSSFGEEFCEDSAPTAGLGLVRGRVSAIPERTKDGDRLKIPHIGWARLEQPKASSWKGSILNSIDPGESVYLVHSFALVTDQTEETLAYCEYGGHKITTAVRCGSVYGCQFHPEKSGPVGLRIIKEFLLRG